MKQFAQSQKLTSRRVQLHSLANACALSMPSSGWLISIYWMLMELGYTYLPVRAVLYFLVCFINFFRTRFLVQLISKNSSFLSYMISQNQFFSVFGEGLPVIVCMCDVYSLKRSVNCEVDLNEYPQGRLRSWKEKPNYCEAKRPKGVITLKMVLIFKISLVFEFGCDLI